MRESYGIAVCPNKSHVFLAIPLFFHLASGCVCVARALVSVCVCERAQVEDKIKEEAEKKKNTHNSHGRAKSHTHSHNDWAYLPSISMWTIRTCLSESLCHTHCNGATRERQRVENSFLFLYTLMFVYSLELVCGVWFGALAWSERLLLIFVKLCECFFLSRIVVVASSSARGESKRERATNEQKKSEKETKTNMDFGWVNACRALWCELCDVFFLLFSLVLVEQRVW